MVFWGSLYPWQPHAAPAGITWEVLVSRATAHITRHDAEDILLNIGLFLPIGFLGFEALFERLRARHAAAGAAAAGIACSITIEYLQLYFSRDASLLDVAANSLGTALGVVLAIVLFHHPLARGFGRVVERADAAGVFLLWLGSQLYPPVPASVGFHILGLTHPRAEELATVTLAIGEMVTLGVIAAALTTRERSRALLLIGAAAAVATRLFSNGRALSKAELLGLIFGLVASSILRRPLPSACLLAVGLVFAGLAPFDFQPVAGDFNWIPFKASLASPWAGGVPILLIKLFRYAGLVWLLHEAGWLWRTTALLATSLLAAIELAQVWIPQRIAELTDPLLALVAAYVLWEISKVEKVARERLVR